jgi:hypothetical protein
MHFLLHALERALGDRKELFADFDGERFFVAASDRAAVEVFVVCRKKIYQLQSH